MATTHTEDDSALYCVHAVPASRPFVWLSRGFDDLLKHPMASLAYGAMVAVLGMLVLAYAHHPFMLAAVTTAFLLVGPIMTAGLCELSRCHDTGAEATFASSLVVMRKQRTALLRFAAILFAFAALWISLSIGMLQAMTGNAAPALASTVWGDVMRQLSGAQIQVYVGVGAVLAAVVFALSVVTVPMIVDRHVSARTAMHMSLRATLRDLPAMLLWAVLIVALVAIGFASNLLGMLVIFPLLGHAAWYAYRDLVD